MNEMHPEPDSVTVPKGGQFPPSVTRGNEVHFRIADSSANLTGFNHVIRKLLCY
jgi:hypothetical protein